MYLPDTVTSRTDYQDCVAFHGHTCMGLTIGYLAARLALELLGIERAVDEELVTIVENDACCCDAIQVLTGCTFGKGNFFFRDHGKMAFTFIDRGQERSIRLVLKPHILDMPGEEQELAERIRGGTAAPAEIKRFETLQESRLQGLFEEGPAAFFTIQEPAEPPPPPARITPSLPCARCGEMVMESKLQEIGGQPLCRACR